MAEATGLELEKSKKFEDRFYDITLELKNANKGSRRIWKG
jgi:hypothetical protein